MKFIINLLRFLNEIYNKFSGWKEIKNLISNDSLGKWIDRSIYLIVSIIEELGFLGFCIHL